MVGSTHEPPARSWLLLRWDHVEVLEVPDFVALWVSGKQENTEIDRNCEEWKEAHNWHPITDSTRAQCDLTSAIPAHDLQLDTDLYQISDETEEWGKGEWHCEESHKTKLDYSFVIVED